MKFTRWMNAVQLKTDSIINNIYITIMIVTIALYLSLDITVKHIDQ